MAKKLASDEIKNLPTVADLLKKYKEEGYEPLQPEELDAAKLDAPLDVEFKLKVVTHAGNTFYSDSFFVKGLGYISITMPIETTSLQIAGKVDYLWFKRGKTKTGAKSLNFKVKFEDIYV